MRTESKRSSAPSRRPGLDGGIAGRTLRQRISDVARPIPLTKETKETADTGTTPFRPRRRSERLCRATNVVLAGAALIVLAPVMLVVALAVKLTSRGPALYMQTRVGEDRRRDRRADYPMYDRRARDLGGRAFAIYKFRSMSMDAERGTGAIWATRQDPRITPVGRLLRKTRLDELPQLFNVVRGDMNIVGPRPERPSLFARLRTEIADYPLRQLAKPGITGWAQINQAYDSSIDDVRSKVRYDLEYLGRQGLAEDVRIMLRTVPVMIFRRGAN